MKVESIHLLVGLAVLVYILYTLRPSWFDWLVDRLSPEREILEEGGYVLDRVLLFSDAIMPPVVRFPDGTKGIFQSFLPNGNGGYDLETDEGVIRNISPVPGVNIDPGDPFATASGRGEWLCNVTSSGEVIEGWRGVGMPQTTSQAERIRLLQKQLSDARVRVDESQREAEEWMLRYNKLIKEIRGTPQKKKEEDENEEE